MKPGPISLYWLRQATDVDCVTNRNRSQVMALTANRIWKVQVPLRYSESPNDSHGYPGGPTFTLTVAFTDDIPTRYEVLKNVGYAFPHSRNQCLLRGPRFN